MQDGLFLYFLLTLLSMTVLRVGVGWSIAKTEYYPISEPQPHGFTILFALFACAVFIAACLSVGVFWTATEYLFGVRTVPNKVALCFVHFVATMSGYYIGQWTWWKLKPQT